MNDNAHIPRDRALCLLFALALSAAVFVYYLAAGLVPFFDAIHLHWPQFALISDFARAGQLVLWNPYQNGGAPDIGYPEFGDLSPLTVGLAVVIGGGYYGFLAYWLTIMWVFGAGASLLALHLGAPRRAAMAITAGLMFSGFFIGSSSHTSTIYGFSFLPLILWRVDVALSGRRFWPAVEAGALYGLSALAGHPQVVTAGGMYVALWAAGRALFPEGPTGDGVGRRLGRAALTLALLLAVALVILSPVYANFFHETAGYSERSGFLPRDHAIAYGQLPLSALATIASPYIATLTVFNRDLWPGTFYTLCGANVGALIPALALMLLATQPRRRFAWWVAGVGLVFLTAALGDATPVRGWLYDLVIPTRFFRHSSIFRAYSIFSLGVLAMLAAPTLSGPAAPRAWKALLAVSAALLPAMAAMFAGALWSVEDRGPWLTAAVAHFVIGWVGAVAVAAYGFRAARQGRAGSRALALMVGLAVFDAGLGLYLSRPLMAVPRERFRWLEDRRSHAIQLNSLDRYRQPEGKPVNNFHLISRRPMIEGFHQMSHRFHSSASLTPLADNWMTEPMLRESALSHDRIWFSAQAVEVAPSDATFAALTARARVLGAIPLVVSTAEDVMRTPPRGAPGRDDAGGAGAIARLPAAEKIPYELLDYRPLRLALRVNPKEPGWILVTDRWSRSWTAKVNGQPAPLMIGNFLWRAVRVGPGPQTVEFDYHPYLFPLLLWLSWGALAVVAGVSLWRRARAALP